MCEAHPKDARQVLRARVRLALARRAKEQAEASGRARGACDAARRGSWHKALETRQGEGLRRSYFGALPEHEACDDDDAGERSGFTAPPPRARAPAPAPEPEPITPRSADIGVGDGAIDPQRAVADKAFREMIAKVVAEGYAREHAREHPAGGGSAPAAGAVLARLGALEAAQERVASGQAALAAALEGVTHGLAELDERVKVRGEASAACRGRSSGPLSSLRCSSR